MGYQERLRSLCGVSGGSHRVLGGPGGLRGFQEGIRGQRVSGVSRELQETSAGGTRDYLRRTWTFQGVIGSFLRSLRGIPCDFRGVLVGSVEFQGGLGVFRGYLEVSRAY